jgi:two-component system sensor histidine kinase SenX3
LQQAILNLLTNAMKYSGQSREIELRLRRENGHAVIEVTDRGVGIAPEEQERIFEKFYRAPTPENRLIPGAGLGLALAEHIAAAHGGRVAVRSSPGQGSTFTIRLPLEKQS